MVSHYTKTAQYDVTLKANNMTCKCRIPMFSTGVTSGQFTNN